MGECWEFNCPKFVDFTSSFTSSFNADDWFVKVDENAAKVWALSASDVLDKDLIDSGLLLDEDDLKKPDPSTLKVKVDENAAKVWALSASDVLDKDLIDSGLLLDEDDLKKPDPSTLKVKVDENAAKVWVLSASDVLDKDLIDSGLVLDEDDLKKPDPSTLKVDDIQVCSANFVAKGVKRMLSPKPSYNKSKKPKTSLVDVRQQLGHRRKTTRASKSVKCATQGESVWEFASTLRKFSEEPVNAAPRARTKPMPFNFSLPKKNYKEGEAFRSMAEQIAEFQTKTPQRFRTRSRNASVSSCVTSLPEGAKVKLTIPKSPNFMSQYRVRSVTAITKERVKQELDYIQKNRFKANPLNLRAIQPPQLKDLKSKPPTKLVPFKLTCPQKRHACLNKVSTEKYEFRARPVPPGLFDGPKVSAQNKVALDTTTKLPPYLWKGRLHRRSKSVSEKSESLRPKIPASFNADFVPHSVGPFKETMVEPFSFDDLDCERMAQKSNNASAL